VLPNGDPIPRLKRPLIRTAHALPGSTLGLRLLAFSFAPRPYPWSLTVFTPDPTHHVHPEIDGPFGTHLSGPLSWACPRPDWTPSKIHKASSPAQSALTGPSLFRKLLVSSLTQRWSEISYMATSWR
jgi:hypothetical protein